MNKTTFRPARVLSLILPMMIAGCCSRVPEGPDRPAFDPASAGREAIAQYDQDGDRKLSGEELAACPALEMALPRIDKNSDGALTAEEIAQRIEYFQTAKTTIISGSTEVTMDGEPLAGATVTFEPESFMGETFKACSGVTDDNGVAFVSGHDSKFPGIYLGFYRVRISKEVNGEEIVPDRYNVESELGYEATDDIPERSNVIQFHLET